MKNLYIFLLILVFSGIAKAVEFDLGSGGAGSTSLGSTITGASAGPVFYGGTGGTLAQDSNLYWSSSGAYLKFPYQTADPSNPSIVGAYDTTSGLRFDYGYVSYVYGSSQVMVMSNVGLHSAINGSAAQPFISKPGSNGGLFFGSNGSNISLANNGTEYVTLSTTGYVGINQTSPSYRLDVNGDGRFVSHLHVGGNFDVAGNTTLTGTLTTGGTGGSLVASTSTLQLVAGYGTGTVSTMTLTAAGDVTLNGASLNAASGLIQATAATKYPALDGTLITNIPQVATANVFTTTQSQTGTGALWKSSGTGAGFQAYDATVQVGIQASAATPSGIVGTTSNHALEFATNNTVRARFTTGGAFVIGATAASATGFQVSSKTVTFDGTGMTFSLGGGAGLTAATFGSASLNFGATAAGTCDTLTVTVTGAVNGDAAFCGIPTALFTSDTYQSFQYSATAANTVTVKRCNLTNATTALSDPAAATVTCYVFR